jgi:hypothetical protein
MLISRIAAMRYELDDLSLTPGEMLVGLAGAQAELEQMLRD